jgi:hypothetical protein
MLKEIPGDLLSEIVNQNGDWLLYYLKAHTLFDVDRIGFVMTLGRRAAQEELERREREVFEKVGAPPVETAVEQVSMAEGFDAVFADMFDVSVLDLSEQLIEPYEAEPAPPHVPLESPNDWVTQDRVPKRDWDEHRWVSPEGTVVLDWHTGMVLGAAVRHGDLNSHGNRLEIRCKRFELPSIIPAPTVVDVDDEPF